jgi:hypothetical protein
VVQLGIFADSFLLCALHVEGEESSPGRCFDTVLFEFMEGETYLGIFIQETDFTLDNFDKAHLEANFS